MSVSFLDLKPFPVKEAEAVILPIPYEATVSYGGGTKEGPEAILAASRQVELWDEQYDWDPSQAIRLATALPVFPEVSGPQAMLDKIRRLVQPWISQGKFIAALGGEHTITTALVQAAQTRYPDLSVVALDAHADLRDSYDGSKLSHACVLRRLYELGRPLTLLGTRAYSQDEYNLMRVAPRFKMFKATELHTPEGWQAALDHLKAIPGPVYLSIDLDALDPSHHARRGHPGTRRPHLLPGPHHHRDPDPTRPHHRPGPGGTGPHPGQHVSEFTAARLLYKALGYIYHSRMK